jgi:hypothetical protein
VSFFNQYSLLILVVLMALLGLAWLLRGPGSRPRQIAAIALLGLLTIAVFLLRPGGDERSAQAAEALLSAGDRPVLLEFYSDY